MIFRSWLLSENNRGLPWLLLEVGGAFFGMGLEEKLLEPMRRKRRDKNNNCSGPNPLPMAKVEAHQNCYGFGKRRLYVMPPETKTTPSSRSTLGSTYSPRYPLAIFFAKWVSNFKPPTPKLSRGHAEGVTAA